MSDTLKDKAAKGLVWGAVNNGATQVLNAIFGIVLARLLSPDDYGLIAMLLVFSTVATALQDSGFVIALTNKRDATHDDYNAVFWFNIMVSIIAYVILFSVSPWIAAFYNEPILTSLSRYFFIGFFIASFSIVPRAILFRRLQQRELALMALSSLLISGAVGITLAANGFAFWGIATQTLVFNFCITIFSWYFSKWRPKPFTFHISQFTPLKPLLGFSCKMLFTYIFNNINNNIFSLLLGRLYNKTEAGVYSQAQKWNVMGSNTITGMVHGVAQPTFVQVGDDKERLCRAFSKMLRFTCFISFPAMLGLALIAREFIIITVTEKWLPSATLMQLLCIAGAFLPLATLYYDMIISRGKSNIYMWNVIIQGCVIMGSLLTVHYLGGSIRDMVIAYVIIVISWTFVWHYFVNREIGFSWYQALKDILPFFFIAAFTMVVTHHLSLFILHSSHFTFYTSLCLMLVRIFLAAIIYLGIIYLSGAKIIRQSWEYIRHKQV